MCLNKIWQKYFLFLVLDKMEKTWGIFWSNFQGKIQYFNIILKNIGETKIFSLKEFCFIKKILCKMNHQDKNYNTWIHILLYWEGKKIISDRFLWETFNWSFLTQADPFWVEKSSKSTWVDLSTKTILSKWKKYFKNPLSVRVLSWKNLNEKKFGAFQKKLFESFFILLLSKSFTFPKIPSHKNSRDFFFFFNERKFCPAIFSW